LSCHGWRADSQYKHKKKKLQQNTNIITCFSFCHSFVVLLLVTTTTIQNNDMAEISIYFSKHNSKRQSWWSFIGFI
jgi:TRAP-type mannitol/chloroaromatic compound transport system permease small subunit